MKILIKKAVGEYVDDDSVGKVHLQGPIDTTACGLADEDYEFVSTSKAITCETCKTFHSWAKQAAKIKN